MAEAPRLEYGSGVGISNECQRLPVRELGVSTRKFLARWLDPPTAGCNKDHIPQNWMGLAELMNFDHQTIQNFENSRKSPTEEAIQAYSLRFNVTVGHLWQFVTELERYDIIEEETLANMLERDVIKFKDREEQKATNERQLRAEAEMTRPVQVPNVSSDTFEEEQDWDMIDRETDQYENMVVDDVETGKTTYFDAFVSYCHDDLPFVQEMIRMLETVHGLKLCVNARDLLAGGSVHFITARLIADRCRKVILVMSPSFLRSPECEFQVKVALSLSPGAKRKILIPILFKYCKMPLVLQHVCLVDYTKIDLAEWFWGRLAASLRESRKHRRLIPPEDLDNLSGVEMNLDMDYKTSHLPDINTLDFERESKQKQWVDGPSDNGDLYGEGQSGLSDSQLHNVYEQTTLKLGYCQNPRANSESPSLPRHKISKKSDSQKSMSIDISQNDDDMADAFKGYSPFNRNQRVRQPVRPVNNRSMSNNSSQVGGVSSNNKELPLTLSGLLSSGSNNMSPRQPYPPNDDTSITTSPSQPYPTNDDTSISTSPRQPYSTNDSINITTSPRQPYPTNDGINITTFPRQPYPPNDDTSTISILPDFELSLKSVDFSIAGSHSNEVEESNSYGDFRLGQQPVNVSNNERSILPPLPDDSILYSGGDNDCELYTNPDPSNDSDEFSDSLPEVRPIISESSITNLFPTIPK